MKIVLQHKSTRLFLTNGGTWSANPVEARDFGTSLKALDFVRRLELDQAHIVLKFTDSRYDIVLQAVVSPQIEPGSQALL